MAMIKPEKNYATLKYNVVVHCPKSNNEVVK